MNPSRIVGIVLLLVGIVLFIIGVNASDSFSDRMSNFFTGHFTDQTVWYMVGGGALALCGGLLAFFGGRRALT